MSECNIHCTAIRAVGETVAMDVAFEVRRSNSRVAGFAGIRD